MHKYVMFFFVSKRLPVGFTRRAGGRGDRRAGAAAIRSRPAIGEIDHGAHPCHRRRPYRPQGLALGPAQARRLQSRPLGEQPGGGVFNAARNLARLGHQVTLVSPRGGDAAADRVPRAAREAGIEDCPLTFLDRATPSYTSILEPDGNLVTALADMALYDALPARRLMTSRLRKTAGRRRSPHRRFQPSRKRACRTRRSRRRHRVPLAVIAVSPAKVVRWRGSLSGISCLAMNAAEAEALTGTPARRAARLARGSQGDRPDRRPRQHGRRTGHRL
jgi:sugar/nucleoside kinase (ribokinase family)